MALIVPLPLSLFSSNTFCPRHSRCGLACCDNDQKTTKKWLCEDYFDSAVLNPTLLILRRAFRGDLEDFAVVSPCAVSKHVPVLRKTAGSLPPAVGLQLGRRENLPCPFLPLASCLLCCCTRSGASYISLIWKRFPSKKECQG